MTQKNDSPEKSTSHSDSPAHRPGGLCRSLWRYSGLATLERFIVRRLFQDRRLEAIHQVVRNLEKKQDMLYCELHRMNHGERQVAPQLDMIRGDHINRYRLATALLDAGDAVLDVGCGIGYGTSMLAQQVSTGQVLGIDINEGAIDYARQHYGHPRAEFRLEDCLQAELPEAPFGLVTCFEVIEHLPQALELLGRIYGWLKPGGRLICSTPNEETLPFSTKQFPFHCRHYTPQEFQDLLARAGFAVEQITYQNRQKDFEFDNQGERKYMIATCQKLEE